MHRLAGVGDGAASRGVGVAAVLDRVARHLEPVEAIVVDAHDHVAGTDLRVREHGGDVVDRTARQVGRLEPLEPRRDGSVTKRGLDLDLQLRVVLGAQRVGGEPWVVGHVRATDDVAEPAKQQIVARGDDEVPVGRGERGERRDRRMAGTERSGHFTGGGVAGDRVLEDRHLTVEHRHVDLGCLAVFARSNSALQMPIAVNSPAVTSPIDVPTRVGGPPGWPVMLMTPPIACTTMSYAGRVASGPVWPKPDTAA